MKILLSWLKEFVEISLPPEAVAEWLTLGGAEVTGLSQVDGLPAGQAGDWSFEMEITPNRPDLLSHLGVARELAALLGREFRMPRWLQKELAVPVSQAESAIPVTIEDAEGCQRYLGLVIEGVRVAPSPPAVAQRLTLLGVRPVNNVVDITNLVLLELGQPLHAFDLETLRGPEIQVRRAKDQETLVTLDGVSRALSSEFLVIADAHRPVALAGVMGGRETEISSRTKRVFLESALFSPQRIRRATHQLKLSSESSYRFERGVDVSMVPMALARAARLIAKVAGGKIVAGPMDTGVSPAPPATIALRPSVAQAVLGMRISAQQQRRFLRRLGCTVSGSSRILRVEPPSFRADLKIPEDLYEELARLFGYERCAATLPPMARGAAKSEVALSEDANFSFDRLVREQLRGCGLQEILSYSLLGPELLTRCRLDPKKTLGLQNPLSLDQSLLRPSLLPGTLEVASRNFLRKTETCLQLFEIGRVYEPAEKTESGSAPSERRALSLFLAGAPSPKWGVSKKPPGFFHLKGIFELLGERLRIDTLQMVLEPGQVSFLQPSMTVRMGEKVLGYGGVIVSGVLSAFEIPEGISAVYAEINLDLLEELPKKPLKVKPLPKVAPVWRDIAIVIPEEVSYAEILGVIQQAAAPLLEHVGLFDVYKGPQVPAGKRSLAFRLTFSAGDRTLTEPEVVSAHEKIVKGLSHRFQATLR